MAEALGQTKQCDRAMDKVLANISRRMQYWKPG